MGLSDHNELRDRVVKEAFRCREALELYAFGMLRDRAAAEDVVQDAFIVVMEKYEVFEEGTSMMAWTRAIVRRKVLQLLDRRKRRKSVLDQVLCDAVDAAFTEVESDQYADDVRSRRHRLENCLGRIADRSRQLLECVYSSEMSYETAAKSVGMGVEAVRKSLYRAKMQLRECLRRDPAGVSP